MQKPDLIAVAWYEREDFDAVRALAPDGGGLQETFDEWLKHATSVVVQLSAQGFRVERVTVKAEPLKAWLAAHNLQSNEQTRARFGHDLASAKYGNKH